MTKEEAAYKAYNKAELEWYNNGCKGSYYDVWKSYDDALLNQEIGND